MKQIFITGGTGYMGSRLIKMLLEKNYSVKAIVRNGSENKLPKGCDYIIANPFDAKSFAKEIPATFIRPWYVVGPGHYWPLLFSPLFKILGWIPSTAQKAKALRLVTLKQMLYTLLYAVENPPETGVNIIEIEEI